VCVVILMEMVNHMCSLYIKNIFILPIWECRITTGQKFEA
jgi:hypothetical protein